MTGPDSSLLPPVLGRRKKSAGACGARSGGETSLESFQEPSMHLFNGQLTVIVTRGAEVTVSAEGLRPARFRDRL